MVTVAYEKWSFMGSFKSGALGFSVLRFWLFFRSVFAAKDFGFSVLVVIAVCGFFVF